MGSSYQYQLNSLAQAYLDGRHRNDKRPSQAGDAFHCDAATDIAEEEDVPPEIKYGSILRHLQPGESFGELALLQRHAKRTATVMSSDAGTYSLIQFPCRGTLDVPYQGRCPEMSR